MGGVALGRDSVVTDLGEVVPAVSDRVPLALDLTLSVLHPYAQYQTGIAPVLPYPAAVDFPHLLPGSLLQS